MKTTGDDLFEAAPLSGFLLARFAEDEAEARNDRRAVPDVDLALGWIEDSMGDAALSIGPARVLAECAAKRRIVELHYEHTPYEECHLCAEQDQRWPCGTLRALAAIYADHADYRQEWRPDYRPGGWVDTDEYDAHTPAAFRRD